MTGGDDADSDPSLRWEAEAAERTAIEEEPRAREVVPGARFVLAAVRAAPPGAVVRPSHLLELVPNLATATALDIAAALLDAGELVTDGGTLNAGPSAAPPASEDDTARGWTFGEGTRAILRAIANAPKRERDGAASSPAVLLFASFFREPTIGWTNLRSAIRDLGARTRDWTRRVDALRHDERPAGSTSSGEDDRRVVRFDPSCVDIAADAAIRHLESDANMFQRTGSLVTISAVTEADARRFPFLLREAPRVHHLAEPTLRERLCAVARFEVARGDRIVVKGPPSEVVSAVLMRGMWPGIRPLRGIIETPTIRPPSQGGDLVSAPGYDEGIGFVYRPPHDVTFPPVPSAPSREDAAAALATLEDVFEDFPFESPREGRSVAVAAALTMIARPAIEGGAPAFLFDATTQGTGKSLLVDVVHKIATGRAAGKMPFPVDRRGADEAELRKVLSTVALSAARSVTFDNLADSVPFGGGSLEGALTTGHFDGRRMGVMEDFSVAWEAIVFATGNNISATPDMYRRSLLVRLASPHEKPQFRPASDYVHPERAGTDRLLAWVGSERPRLVAAALTLLRAFIVAGAPTCAACPGSFEAWGRLVASAIVWAGGADPFACLMGADDAADRPDESALRIVVRDLPRLDERRRGVTIKDLLARLYPRERVRGEPLPPDGFDDLREALEELSPPTRPNGPPDTRELGKRLAGLRGKIAGGLILARSARNADGGLARWVVQSAARPVPALGNPEDV